jgi:hypothetical protein
VWGILKSMPSALTKKELASLLNLLDGDARPIDTVRVCLCLCLCIYTHMYNLKNFNLFLHHPLSFQRLSSTNRYG